MGNEWHTKRNSLVLLSGVPRGGGLGGETPSRNSEVLTTLSRIPSSVENTSVTT
jgi:hypothetical protein